MMKHNEMRVQYYNNWNIVSIDELLTLVWTVELGVVLFNAKIQAVGPNSLYSGEW